MYAARMGEEGARGVVLPLHSEQNPGTCSGSCDCGTVAPSQSSLANKPVLLLHAFAHLAHATVAFLHAVYQIKCIRIPTFFRRSKRLSKSLYNLKHQWSSPARLIFGPTRISQSISRSDNLLK